MKKALHKLFYTLLMLAASLSYGHAQIHVIDNNPNSGALFTDIQPAIDAANNGDTLIIAGSETKYGSATVNKRLVIIGAGYNPAEPEQFGYKTKIGDLIFYNESQALDKNASGSYVEGLELSSLTFGKDEQDTLQNVIITKCNITYRTYFEDCYNIRLINNLIGGHLTSSNNQYKKDHANFDAGSNIFILNNIIRGGYIKLQGFNILVSHNVITEDTWLFDHSKQITFSNNIIYGRNPGGERNDCDFCTITHNLISNKETVTLDFATNSTGNNLENVNPKFVNAPEFSFDYAYDYRLQDDSPAKGAGSDGSDLGIFGGAYPWPVGGESPYITSIQSQLPKITEFNVKTGSVKEGGTVEAEFGARVSDNQ